MSRDWGGEAAGWDFTDWFFVIDFMKKMVYPINNTNPKLGRLTIWS